MPDEQRRNFTMPPVSSTAGETFPCAYGLETGRPAKTHRLRRGAALAGCIRASGDVLDGGTIDIRTDAPKREVIG